MDTPSKEEYCDPANRVKIASTTPYLLPFYDDYCNQVPDVCLLPPPEPDSPEPVSSDPPIAKGMDNDNFFFWLWIIAAIITLIIITLALLIP